MRITEISGGVPFSISGKDPEIVAELRSFAIDANASFLAFHVYNHKLGRQVIFANSYEWYYRSYVSENLFANDCIMQCARLTKTPFEWADIGSRIELPHNPNLKTLQVARNVVTIPAGDKEFTVALHIGSDNPDTIWRARISDLIWFGTMVAKQQFQRVLRTRPSETAEISLDRMQIECLALLAAGKDLHEIAQLTGRKHATISRHVAEAMTRLNANNQTHAIVMAHFLNLI